MSKIIDAFRKLALTQTRKFISPSTRFKLRENLAWIQEQLSKASIWRWEISKFPHYGNSPYKVIYIGRKNRRDFAKALLGIGLVAVDTEPDSAISEGNLFVSEFPLPGALKVPGSLRVVIPLGRTIEEISSGFDKKLRQVLRNLRADYRMQLANSEAEIKHADQHLLQPYANARHGASASQISSLEVLRIAQGIGRLDLVLSRDKVVGCILGCEITYAKKRYWGLIRCGYPEEVFSDAKRLRETNAINFYLALEWAIQNGFDYYDMGTCMGRPEDGLLQWKKRWGGLIDTMGTSGCYYVRLPGKGAAQFLWDSPLFAIEGNNLTLHLGLPDGKSDDDFSLRFKEMNRGMGIGGLQKIYLHHTNHPSEGLLLALRSHFQHLKVQPLFECVPSN